MIHYNISVRGGYYEKNYNGALKIDKNITLKIILKRFSP